MMPTFITRVELHQASAKDYSVLHAAMTDLKFHRYICDDRGVKFTLPTAVYYSYGDLRVEQVRDLAQRATSSTGRPSWILVTEYKSAAWSLPVAATPQPNDNALTRFSPFRSPLAEALANSRNPGSGW